MPLAYICINLASNNSFISDLT